MNRKAKQLIVAIVLVLLVIIGYNLFLSERAQINRVIKKVKKAVENRDIRECFNYVSQNYYDPYGNDCKTLRAFFVNFFEDSNNITVFIIRNKKEFSLSRCDITMHLVISSSSSDYGFIRGQEFLKATLYKEKDKTWRCIRGEILEKSPFLAPKKAFGEKEIL